ncbi:MAG: hypothetical protein HY291_08990 [Planctomycetes bacterium]|nr:hypothetical protein [Planctomycetota bacterium]
MDFEPNEGRKGLIPPPLARDEALRALSDIRAVIDRTAKYTTFSALSGFVAGAAALVGSGACGLISEWPGADPSRGLLFLLVWTCVLAVAAAGMALLTWQKARQRGQRVWTPIARTAFLALIGPGAAGVIGSAALVHAGAYALLPGLWLTLYGCGMYVVSFYAANFLRWIGMGFMALGAAAWLGPLSLGALWLGLGFGILHLIFGAIVLKRYRG